jgi:tripeptidyl-peptidase I
MFLLSFSSDFLLKLRKLTKSYVIHIDFHSFFPYFFLSFYSFSLLIAAVFAASVAYATGYSLNADWKLVGPANKDAMKTFSVAMPMRDFPGLEKELLEISDPYNKRYGQWLTAEEADAFAATPKDIADEVHAWAQSTGATCTRLPESLKCAGSVASIEALLSTELSEFVHKKLGHRVIRTSAPATVPIELEGKVVMVTGLTRFPIPRLGNSRPMDILKAISAPLADYAIVPETLTNLYNVTTVDGTNSSTQAPVEFQNYPGYVQSDLDTFTKNVGVADFTIPSNQFIGPYAPNAQAESTLDEQYIGAVGEGNQNWYWTEADWQYEFGQDLQTQNPIPAVLSISYAWYELDQCDISPGVAPCQGQTVPIGSRIFVNACNQLYAKAGARGVTMVTASGDSGSHGRTDPGCTDPVTRIDFPSSSPYMLSVGATELSNGQTGAFGKAPICSSTLQCATAGYEVVASHKTMSFFSSGGGFSNVAPTPAWQAAVVANYLKNTSALPPTGDFNATGRGSPDVAALGHNYYIELGGAVSSVDGTSAATPVIAGLLANLNAWRLANGKPVLGFVNPLLYSIAAADPLAFNDVVQGDNQCTEDAVCILINI